MHYNEQVILLVFTFTFLLLVGSALAGLAKHLKLSYPVLLILTGILLGSLDLWISAKESFLPWHLLSQSEIGYDLIILILLPVLVFETAQNLDVRRVIENGKAILTLAVPGLFLSAGIMALVIALFTPLSWIQSLLIGVILSATDPASIITNFKQIGAPRDLSVLVEGESLFNDATTIALTKIILIVIASGALTNESLGTGLWMFIISLTGGVGIGWVCGIFAYKALIALRHIPYIEISLTLFLAYFSYLSAEILLDASGIIATAVSGMYLSIHKPLPISEKTENIMVHVWSYLSHVATSLIFLLVGLWIVPQFNLNEFSNMLIVILAMLLSRSIIIYGLLPKVGYLRKHPRRILNAYRHVLFWGGMRGAISLALAMSLTTLPNGQHMLSLILGAVLFSILVQGLSLGYLIKKLKLSQSDVAMEVEKNEAWLEAKNHALDETRFLQQTALKETGAPDELMQQLNQDINDLKKNLKSTRNKEFGPVGEWKYLLTRGLSIELNFLHRLLSQGLLSVSSYSFLKTELDNQLEALRHDYPRPDFFLTHSIKNLPNIKHSRLFRWFYSITSMSAEKFIIRDYEAACIRQISCLYTINKLNSLIKLQQIPEVVTDEVIKIYSAWSKESHEKINFFEQNFSSLANKEKRSLVRRMVYTTELIDLEQQMKLGCLSPAQFEVMEQELTVLLETELESNIDKIGRR